VGLLRYIIQGFGWELGAQAAREGIDAVERRAGDGTVKPLSKREQRRAERAQRKQATRERKAREAAIARNEARIEAELRALKKKQSNRT